VPCYYPLNAWRTSHGVVFRDTIDSQPIKLGCGNCIGCRLSRSYEWASRLVHEKRFHKESSFITLTYDKEHLPPGGSLDVKHFQDFMKRLRKASGYTKLRFFHCGEYGDQFGRPHYHAIIFGRDFLEGATGHQTTPRGDTTWISPDLSKLWPFGFHQVGKVTFESCAYVARYVTKKVTGRRAASHYERFSEYDGECTSIKPEYCTMSRRPGIGALHFHQLSREIYPQDFIVSGGKKMKPPKFYDKLLEKFFPELYLRVKDERECALTLSPVEERSPRRLAVRETVKQAQIGQLTRKYEIG